MTVQSPPPKWVIVLRMILLCMNIHRNLLRDLAASRVSALLRSACESQLQATWERRPLCFERVGLSPEALSCVDLLCELLVELRSIDPQFTEKYVLYRFRQSWVRLPDSVPFLLPDHEKEASN